LGGGGKTILIKCDVTDWDSVQAMVKKTIEEFGQVDVLVNNVGWVFERLFVQKPIEEMEKEIARNFWSVINCDRAVLDHMIERKYGKIVNVASDAGRMGEYNESVYAGCKGGVIAMSKSIARETARYGININSVCPGAMPPQSKDDFSSESIWMDAFDYVTDEIRQKMASKYPMRRLGSPEDIAAAAVFLASDAASYMTGQTLSVSGGYTMI
jgi:2-hydroxycyclohexanecarboxyl-CoA dehydrogenase